MKEKGLSLLELLISAVILAALMTGMANVFLAGRRHIFHSRVRIQAAELTKFFLNPLYLQVRQDQWASNCLGSGTGCPTEQIQDSITYSPSWSIDDVSGTTLRRVTLHLNWTEGEP